MVRRALHGRLIPARLRPGSGDLEDAMERGMIALDRGEKAGEVPLDGRNGLTWNGAELQGHLAFAARSARVIPEIVVLLVDHIERMGGKSGKLGVRLERHPSVPGRGREAGPDATDDLGLLLDRVHVSRASLGAVAEEQLRRRA